MCKQLHSSACIISNLCMCCGGGFTDNGYMDKPTIQRRGLESVDGMIPIQSTSFLILYVAPLRSTLSAQSPAHSAKNEEQDTDYTIGVHFRLKICSVWYSTTISDRFGVCCTSIKAHVVVTVRVCTVRVCTGCFF